MVTSLRATFGVDYIYCWHGLPAYWSGISLEVRRASLRALIHAVIAVPWLSIPPQYTSLAAGHARRQVGSASYPLSCFPTYCCDRRHAHRWFIELPTVCLLN